MQRRKNNMQNTMLFLNYTAAIYHNVNYNNKIIKKTGNNTLDKNTTCNNKKKQIL